MYVYIHTNIYLFSCWFWIMANRLGPMPGPCGNMLGLGPGQSINIDPERIQGTISLSAFLRNPICCFVVRFGFLGLKGLQVPSCRSREDVHIPYVVDSN